LGYEESINFDYGKIKATPISDRVKMEEIIEFSNFLDGDGRHF
jgi:hypothetical protein